MALNYCGFLSYLSSNVKIDEHCLVKWMKLTESDAIKGVLKMRNDIYVREGILNFWLMRLDNTYLMTKLIFAIMEEIMEETETEKIIFKAEVEETKKKSRNKCGNDELELFKKCVKDAEEREKVWGRRKSMNESLKKKLKGER